MRRACLTLYVCAVIVSCTAAPRRHPPATPAQLGAIVEVMRQQRALHPKPLRIRPLPGPTPYPVPSVPRPQQCVSRLLGNAVFTDCR